VAGNYGPVRFSVLADEHHVVMNYRNTVRLEQQIVSTEAGLAATIGFSSARPVGGKMFLLTAPFIERPSHLIRATKPCSGREIAGIRSSHRHWDFVESSGTVHEAGRDRNRDDTVSPFEPSGLL